MSSDAIESSTLSQGELCETTEGRQKIVDWMRWGVDHINKGVSPWPGWGLTCFRLWLPISTIKVRYPSTTQIENGDWPDDDAALLAWWNTEGKQGYRETLYAPKCVRPGPGPNSYPSDLPDTPPTYSFQQHRHAALIRSGGE